MVNAWVPARPESLLDEPRLQAEPAPARCALTDGSRKIVMKRFYVYKSVEPRQLRSQRYLVVDRTTNLPVGEETTQRAARETAVLYNSGVFEA